MRPPIARKRFGQNFLVDQQIITDFVDLLAVQRDDLLVEIGPGLGALTGPLLRRLDHLHVVEIDRDIIIWLLQAYTSEKLTVHAGDALAFAFGELADAAGTGLRVVGNLPYNISTPLLFHLAGFGNCVRDMHFMLQKEVVERMVAVPGSGEFGRLSVMLQYRFVMHRLLDVPPEAFDPVPKVHSAIVRLIPRPAAALSAIDAPLFARLVSCSPGWCRRPSHSDARCCATVSGAWSTIHCWQCLEFHPPVGPRIYRLTTTPSQQPQDGVLQ